MINTLTDTKVSEVGGGGSVPGAGAEVPLHIPNTGDLQPGAIMLNKQYVLSKVRVLPCYFHSNPCFTLDQPNCLALTHTHPLGFISFSSFSVNKFIETVTLFSQIFNCNPNLTIQSPPN